MRIALAMSTDPTTDAFETPDNDAALLARFGQRRNATDLEQLVERHWASGYRLALRCLGDPAAAEDATQQALLDLVEVAPRFDQRRAFAPWFRTLVLNRVRKQARAAERRRRHEVGAASLRPERNEGARIDRLDAEVVAAQVAALPEDVRLPVVLHYYEGLSHADVAEALGCPKGTAASRIRRGLERLGESLAGAGAAVALPDLEAALRAAPPVRAPRAPATARLLPRVTTSTGAAIAAALVAATIVGAVAGLIILPGGSEPSRAASAPGRRANVAVVPGALVAGEPVGPARPGPGAGAPAPSPAPIAALQAEEPAPAPAANDSPLEATPADTSTAPVHEAKVELVLRDDLGRPLVGPVVVRVMEVRREAGDVISVAVAGLEAVTVAPGESARLDAPAGVSLAFRVEDATRDRARFMMGHEPSANLAPFWTIYPRGPGEDFVLHPGEDRLLSGVVPRASRLVVSPSGPSRDEPATVELSFRSSVDASGSVSSSVARREVMRYLYPPGRVRVRVTCSGFDTFEAELELSPGEVTEVAPVLVRSPVRVLGVVVDEQERAVIGARVEVEEGGPAASTAADGTFSLPVGVGASSLIVSAEGHASTRVVGDVSADEPWVVRVTLRRAGTLVLTAVDATGAPLSAAWCEVRGAISTTPDLAHLDPTRGDPAGAGSWSMRDRTVEPVDGPDGAPIALETLELGGETSPEGLLRLSRVPPGRYEVRLEDGAWREVEVRAGEVTRVELAPE